MLLCHAPAEAGGREEQFYTALTHSSQNCWEDVDTDSRAEDGAVGGGIGVRRTGLGKGKMGLGVLISMGWSAGGGELHKGFGSPNVHLDERLDFRI